MGCLFIRILYNGAILAYAVRGEELDNGNLNNGRYYLIDYIEYNKRKKIQKHYVISDKEIEIENHGRELSAFNINEEYSELCWKKENKNKFRINDVEEHPDGIHLKCSQNNEKNVLNNKEVIISLNEWKRRDLLNMYMVKQDEEGNYHLDPVKRMPFEKKERPKETPSKKKFKP